MNRLEWTDAQTGSFERQYLDTMEADRIGAVGGTSAEYALRGSRQVVAGMDAQEVATGTIQPSKQENFLPGSDPVEGRRRPWLKDEQSFRCSFVALLRGVARISQGRFDPSDRRQLEATVVHFAPTRRVTGSGTSQPQLVSGSRRKRGLSLSHRCTACQSSFRIRQRVFQTEICSGTAISLRPHGRPS